MEGTRTLTAAENTYVHIGQTLAIRLVQDHRQCSISRDERVGVCAVQGIARILDDGLGKVTPMDVQQHLGSLRSAV